MPPLEHSINGNFDINESNVIKWLISQPEIKQKIFDLAKAHGYIVFDPFSKKWYGSEYKKDM